MKRIGIIGAMEPEVALLKEASTDLKTTEIAGTTFVEGLMGSRKVVIAQCGMGKVNAALCAHTMIQQFVCDAIINSGVAGSLSDELEIGDFVISKQASQHDFDASPIGFQKAEIPYTGLTAFQADPTLIEAATSAAKAVVGESHYRLGAICSGDQFIIDVKKKESLHEEFRALCCEMEGGAIAQACHLNGVPWVIIRCISDKPDGSEIVNFEEFSAKAARKGSEVVQYMIEHF